MTAMQCPPGMGIPNPCLNYDGWVPIYSVPRRNMTVLQPQSTPGHRRVGIPHGHTADCCESDDKRMDLAEERRMKREDNDNVISDGSYPNKSESSRSVGLSSSLRTEEDQPTHKYTGNQSTGIVPQHEIFMNALRQRIRQNILSQAKNRENMFASRKPRTYKEKAVKKSTHKENLLIKRERFLRTINSLQQSGMLTATLKAARLMNRNQVIQKEMTTYLYCANFLIKSVMKNPQNAHMLPTKFSNT